MNCTLDRVPLCSLPTRAWLLGFFVFVPSKLFIVTTGAGLFWDYIGGRAFIPNHKVLLCCLKFLMN